MEQKLNLKDIVLMYPCTGERYYKLLFNHNIKCKYCDVSSNTITINLDENFKAKSANIADEFMGCKHNADHLFTFNI